MKEAPPGWFSGQRLDPPSPQFHRGPLRHGNGAQMSTPAAKLLLLGADEQARAVRHAADRPGLYKEFPRDFFDLVIVDECHRGSSREESNWREILEWFQPAYQLGMTATPLRDENRDTYLYFGNPVYTYSLKQGIEDGFLAPYRVHRIVTQWDAAGCPFCSGRSMRCFSKSGCSGTTRSRCWWRVFCGRNRRTWFSRSTLSHVIETQSPSRCPVKAPSMTAVFHSPPPSLLGQRKT